MQKKTLLLMLVLTLGSALSMWSQTVVLDFEDPTTSTQFQYFGSGLDGQLTSTLANPNASGINTSATVMKYVKPADAMTWAGAFSNPNPSVAIDAINNNMLCVKVHSDIADNLTIKLENSTTGGDNWELTQPIGTTGEWVNLCFDFSMASEAAPNTAAAGHSYSTVVLFFGLGTAGNGTDSAVYYVDDMVLESMDPECNIIFDFDSAATSTQFQTFGGSFEGVLTPVVANPAPDAVNMSDSVLLYVKAGDAPTWGGAFSNPDPVLPVDLTNGGDICVKVLMDNIGTVTMKLENSTTGGDNWTFTMPNTVANAWEEICFSSDSASIDGAMTPAAGHAYSRIVFFIDLGTAGSGTNDTTYVDDFCLRTPAAPDSADVTFTVDMNSYTGSFTQPYVSGTFNGWSGTSNPLDDTDGDGVWSTTLKLASGQLEYKFTLDDWNVEEIFNGTEKLGCTLRSGDFVNRVASISANTALDTVCFNSCYACGEGAMITINLGLGTAMADSGGVYLAGGAEFGAPGGRFRMNDDDQDGVYTITFERQKGFGGYYTFANGNCPDYSCKENIAGQDCANPANFNDRFLNSVSQDTTINTCFAICSDNTDCTVGIDDLDFTKGLFTVAPSPFGSTTELTFSSNLHFDRQIRVMTANGQLIVSKTIRGSETGYILNLSNYASGMYFVHVRIGNQYETKKVLKQ